MQHQLQQKQTTMSTNPEISVCMAMRNASRYLRECIDSILGQTFADFELLIVDDSSTDGSVDIVRSYADPRIRLICREHDFIASLNTLLCEARGRYIARMDADDVMMPDRLQVEFDYLEAHPEVAAVCSHATRIDASSNPVGHIGQGAEARPITPRMMCETNHVCNPTTMMRREVIDSCLGYDCDFKYAEDYHFWCRVVADYGPMVCLPQTLLLYRNSDTQVTVTHREEMDNATDRIRHWLTSLLVDRANPDYVDPAVTESGKELTLIIPFLNEGEEVENTVQSFREFGGDRMEIIVINDCSYDSYPYMERLTAIPGVTYILNRERLGVAGSRDKGVDLCRTPYFLLLDAHMRAYDDSWLTEIPRLLRENDRRILCCQNKPLEKDLSGKVSTDNETPTHYGARLIISRRPPVPGIDWIDEELDPDSNTELIPSVLGAGYGAGCRYWHMIGGLKGLRQYGCDEQLMSLKTWLEGGECVLLKDVILGHIYRKRMPYEVSWPVPIFNNLLVTETLFPLRERIMARAAAYTADRQRFVTAFTQLRDYLTANPEMRMHGEEHRKRFTRFIKFNSRYTAVNRRLNADISERLDEIRDVILADAPCEAGLYEGKTGRALWLMLYARATGNSHCLKIAREIVGQVLDNMPLSDVGFATGLSGIGWALIYLEHNRLISGISEALETIDRIVIDSITTVADRSFDSGTAGIMAYICARSASDSFHNIVTEHIPAIDNMANEILADTHDPVAAYPALLWHQLRSDSFTELPPLYLTDWMTPGGFVARDRRFWSLSLRDGILATSINVILNNH